MLPMISTAVAPSPVLTRKADQVIAFAEQRSFEAKCWRTLYADVCQKLDELFDPWQRFEFDELPHFHRLSLILRHRYESDLRRNATPLARYIGAARTTTGPTLLPFKRDLQFNLDYAKQG